MCMYNIIHPTHQRAWAVVPHPGDDDQIAHIHRRWRARSTQHQILQSYLAQ